MKRSPAGRTALLAASLVVTLTGCNSYDVTVTGSNQPVNSTMAPGDLSAAQSNPVEDSYYPQHGEPYFDALHYNLALDWKPSKKLLSGTATITFRVTTDRNEVQLDLGDPLLVSAATLDGRAVTTSRGSNTVKVATGPIAKDSRHVLTITYSGTPVTTPAPSTRGDQAGGLGFSIESDNSTWTMQEPFGAFTWYPVNDQPSDKAFYDATLTSHEGQQGVFNGAPGRSQVSGDTTVRSFHLDKPAASYLTTVAFGKYTLQQDKGPNNLPLYYWYPTDDTTDKPNLEKTPQILQYLETLLGPYPFASAGTLMVPSDSAMETQTLVTMGQFSAPDPGEFAAVLAHEYAHQWSGDAVTPTDWRDVWLNESLAMFIQAKYEDHAGITAYDKTINQYRAMDGMLRQQAGPPGNYDKRQFAASNVYLCGALMYDAMATAYGQKFWAALKTWPDTKRYGNVSRDDLIKHFSDALGVDLRPWITHWLESPTTPTDAPPKLPDQA